jgi:hypothetical protein
MIRLEVAGLTADDESRSSHRPLDSSISIIDFVLAVTHPQFHALPKHHTIAKFVAYPDEFQAIMQQY